MPSNIRNPAGNQTLSKSLASKLNQLNEPAGPDVVDFETVPSVEKFIIMELTVKGVIGFTGNLIFDLSDVIYCFSGNVPNSLHYTPCGQYLVYPLGSLVVVKHIKTDKEVFLDGHTSDISCLKVSHGGRMAASGQVSNMGVKVIDESDCV